MKNKKLLAIVLLSLSFCFLSRAGYGEIKEWMLELEAHPTYIEFALLKARVDYIMFNVINAFWVHLDYDRFGRWKENFPEGVDTQGKIVVYMADTLGTIGDKSGAALLGEFKKELKSIYISLKNISSDMDTDIVAYVLSKETIPLAYFYQGEYHLWED